MKVFVFAQLLREGWISLQSWIFYLPVNGQKLKSFLVSSFGCQRNGESMDSPNVREDDQLTLTGKNDRLLYSDVKKA